MFEIRKMRPDEAEQVREADREAFTNSPFGERTGLKQKPEEELKGWQTGGESFRIALSGQDPNRAVLVAVADESVVGFATFEYWPEKQSGKVVNSAVLPAYRGRGIGTALIKRLLEALKSLGARTAEVQTAHVPAACRIYEKAGFKLINRERKQTKDGREYDHSYYELRFL